MKTNEIQNKGHHRLANLSAIAIVLFLGVHSFFVARQMGAKSTESLVVFCLVVALALLIPVFRLTMDFSRLAFFAPAVILAFNILVIIWGGDGTFFLLVCLCACGVSCLYVNFWQTTVFAVVQAALVIFLFISGYSVTGTDMPLDNSLFSLAVFLFSSVILLILNRLSTVALGRAMREAHSFRTFLSTTANYLAMVDQSNKVTYVSKPLSQLAGISEPELATGRSFIDLFPIRELKLFAGEMIGRRERHETDWEFVLDGQKRYFKAASNILSGTFRGTLVNLHDMTFLAERDEIAAMKDGLKIGIFFMDRNYVIQDNYSRYLEELLSETELKGKVFTELLADSVTTKELDAIKDYFGMVFERTFDQSMLEDINPLNELHYVSTKTVAKKIFHVEFITVERGKGETFVLVAVYDVTAKVELQKRLEEEEGRRQEEMRAIFELIQVDPNVFADFLGDAEYEFSRIDHTLKNDKLDAHSALVEVYQSVHAIKSNAVILGLNTFGKKVHEMESKIKKLREQETKVSFDEMLKLTLAIEGLSNEKEGFKTIIDKINSFKVGGGQRQSEYVLIETLAKTTDKAAEDLGKKVTFVATDVSPTAVEIGPRRVMKEVLVQLIRNSVVHGIEPPDERVAKGKKETGVISLSIKTDGKVVQIKLTDDGRGIDYKKIAAKALSLNMIKPEDVDNKNALTNAMFSPGFSTADEEGVHAGRGIGLNLVRDRVRDAKGNVKLQTEPGKGTVFTVLFPAENRRADG